MSTNQKFRYQLEPLLKKHAWELDAIQLEMADANKVVEQKKSELQTIQQEIDHARAELVALNTQGRSFDLTRHRVLKDYLVFQLQCLRTKQAEISKAESNCNETRVRLNHALQLLKSIEKHKEKVGAEHAEKMHKLDFLAADELWLLSNAGMQNG